MEIHEFHQPNDSCRTYRDTCRTFPVNRFADVRISADAVGPKKRCLPIANRIQLNQPTDDVLSVMIVFRMFPCFSHHFVPVLRPDAANPFCGQSIGVVRRSLTFAAARFAVWLHGFPIAEAPIAEAPIDAFLSCVNLSCVNLSCVNRNVVNRMTRMRMRNDGAVVVPQKQFVALAYELSQKQQTTQNVAFVAFLPWECHRQTSLPGRSSPGCGLSPMSEPAGSAPISQSVAECFAADHVRMNRQD